MERARKGEDVLLNDVRHSAVVKFASASSRILWIKLKFSRVKVCVGVGYDPKEGDGEERERKVLERHGQDTGLSQEWI